MAKSQHPAAKAGRLVRAVGLGVARELEKRADAPPRARAEPPPPPPPLPTKDFYGRMIFALLIASLVATLFVVLKVDQVLPHEARGWFRIVLTVILGLGAFVQLSNWRRANERLAQRFLTRVWGPRGPMNRREKTFARIGREGLALVGIIWLAAAVFEFLIAIGVADAGVVG
ncbi:MAG TPA: hypothetical protein VGL76_12475 [Gaiellaceae bacterium]|jgi:hypothetical protein